MRYNGDFNLDFYRDFEALYRDHEYMDLWREDLRRLWGVLYLYQA